MFNINDFIMYGTIGVCEIVSIKKEQDKEYYILKPLSGNLLLRTPVKNNQEIRMLHDENEIKNFIKTMPSVEPIMISDAKQRNLLFQELLKTGKCSDLIVIIKSLYLTNLEKTNNNKKPSVKDKEILTKAQKRLNEEFGFVLQIPDDEVEEYILRHVDL